MQQTNTKVDTQHSYERVYQNEERDRRDEVKTQKPKLPIRFNSATIRNQTKKTPRRRNKGGRDKYTGYYRTVLTSLRVCR